jgi:autotransporter strand-loop-strand O-heptosyltransferase
MRICQVTPGLLPIPPNGWGAIERIIWEIHNNTIALGHHSEIRYLNDVDDSFDIIHIHVGNLAVEAKKRGLKYVFTLHDHHAYVYGKDSTLYLENLEAIEGSEISFVPARFLIPYFNNHPKLHYLEHGVNNDLFYPAENKPDILRILCVANNGFAGNNSFDRKGFSYAIQAAKNLGLPITIAGPSNNKAFFERYRQKYDKLTTIYDLNDKTLVKAYQEHSIFLSPSILEAGHPNLTLLEAMACGLPVISTFEAAELPGLIKVERDIGQIMNKINYVIENYNDIRNTALLTAKKHSFLNITKKLFTFYKNIKKTENTMREKLIGNYEKTPIRIKPTIVTSDTIHYTFVGGAKVEIIGKNDFEYRVEFFNQDTNELEYATNIRTNHWCKPSKEYLVNWLIRVFKDNQLIFEHKFDLTDKRVYIAINSSAIGDTLAWFPILEEFRKKHNCKLIVSTFKNEWFIDTYPEIKFARPGDTVNDLYAMYSIGWYYNGEEIEKHRVPINFREHPLQDTASSILGMTPAVVKPKLSFKAKEPFINEKYVVIAPHASAHAKYWNNPGGWQVIINHLNNNGYKVVMITQERLGDAWHDSKLGGTLTGVIDKTGNIQIHDRINDIKHASLFIGVGSGLSWLSWALDTKTILISGFSYPYTEFEDEKCIRVFNENPNACTGCFNRHWLNPGDWDWCPDQKNTERMFECSKTIQISSVIKAINQQLNIPY